MFEYSIIFELCIKFQQYCRIITAMTSFVNVGICGCGLNYHLQLYNVLTTARIDAVGGDLQHVSLCACICSDKLIYN